GVRDVTAGPGRSGKDRPPFTDTRGRAMYFRTTPTPTMPPPADLDAAVKGAVNAIITAGAVELQKLAAEFQEATRAAARHRIGMFKEMLRCKAIAERLQAIGLPTEGAADVLPGGEAELVAVCRRLLANGTI